MKVDLNSKNLYSVTIYTTGNEDWFLSIKRNVLVDYFCYRHNGPLTVYMDGWDESDRKYGPNEMSRSGVELD